MNRDTAHPATTTTRVDDDGPTAGYRAAARVPRRAVGDSARGRPPAAPILTSPGCSGGRTFGLFVSCSARLGALRQLFSGQVLLNCSSTTPT